MTEEQQRAVELYLTTGMSFSAIAEAIGGTRSKVAGIIYRHCPKDAPRRGPTNGARRRSNRLLEEEKEAAERVFAKGGNAKLIAETLEVSLARATRLIEVAHARAAAQSRIDPATCRDSKGCRYITGDVGSPGWRYCQQPQSTGSSYCGHHHAICHRGLNDAEGQGKDAYTVNYRYRRYAINGGF